MDPLAGGRAADKTAAVVDGAAGTVPAAVDNCAAAASAVKCTADCRPSDSDRTSHSRLDHQVSSFGQSLVQGAWYFSQAAL